MGRDSRRNCILKNELRRYEPRSRFPKKSPFRRLFRAFYPHPAYKSSLRAEGATSGRGHPLSGTRETWAAPNVPPATVLPPHAPRSTPHAPRRQDQRGQAGHRPSPRWLLPDTDHRIGKDRTGPDLDGRSLLFQYGIKPGDAYQKINPFVLARRRPRAHLFVPNTIWKGGHRGVLRVPLPCARVRHSRDRKSL